jgi:hypothetical protein
MLLLDDAYADRYMEAVAEGITDRFVSTMASSALGGE